MLERRWLIAGASTLGAVVVAALWWRTIGLTGSQVLSIGRDLSAAPAVVAVLFVGVQIVLAAAKWRLIERAFSAPPPSWRRALTVGAVAGALGQVAPTPVVTAVLRGASNRAATSAGLGRGVVGGAFDYGTDLLIVAVALPFCAAWLLPWWGWGHAVAAVACALGGGAAAFCVGMRASKRVRAAARRTARALTAAGPGAAPRLLLLSTLRVANLGLISVFVARAAGLTIDAAVLAAVPPVTVSNALVALPGGLGVTEWSFTAALGLAGVPSEAILRFAVANRLLLSAAAVGWGIVGALWLVTPRPLPAPAGPRAAA